MKKSIFEWSVKEIKEYQVKNHTGGFQTDPTLPERIFKLCRMLEKLELDDKYLRSLNTPLAIWFTISFSGNNDVYIVEKDNTYSFWSVSQGEFPVPIASNFEDMYSSNEFYSVYKAKMPIQSDSPTGKIVRIYKKGYFTE